MTLRDLCVRASLALLLCAPLSSASAQDWQEIYVDDGVTVSKAEMEGTRLVAFKGQTTFDHDAAEVLYVLMDNDHRLEWVGRLYDNQVLEQATPYEYVLYQAFELPFPFKNRDYVYRGQVTQDPSTGVITLAMGSIEYPDAPETVGVRADLVNSRYRITPLGAGRAQVEVEILTDPAGAMPIWLVNLIQRSWPYDTLTGIGRQLEQPYTGTYPLPQDDVTAASAAVLPDAG